MASLFVTDLHLNVTEEDLIKKFSSIGPLSSVRVCRDAITNQSLGYAYVNFVEEVHAKLAIETMNFDVMEGKAIRLLQSEKNPFLRKLAEPNVFVKNLHKVIITSDLYTAFSQFGTVLDCKIAQDRNGVSKCYGFVHFEEEESVTRSIEHLNGLKVNDKILCVERFTKQPLNEPTYDTWKSQGFTNVYIKNLDNDFTEKILYEMFSKIGKITSHKIMKNENGNSRGFGFVSFEDKESAANAIKAFNGKILRNGKILYVTRAQTKNERDHAAKFKRELITSSEAAKLFVSNLDDTIDDLRLRKEFECYGTVISAKVMMNEGKSIGLGYVCFAKANEAMDALTAMNGRFLGNKPIFIGQSDEQYIPNPSNGEIDVQQEVPHYSGSSGTAHTRLLRISERNHQK